MAGVLDEHHSYLALEGRAESFARAIAAVVPPGARVADLGCGFGVLGLQCLQAGASQVWGIDESDAIEIAREAAHRAGFAGRYHCVSGSTFDATLPEPVDVAICDHVGFFGIDYGIIDLMADARRRLVKPGGVLIPRSMDLYLAGVSSERCRRFVGRWDDEPIPAEFRWLRSHAVNSKHALPLRGEDLCSAGAAGASVTLGESGDEVLTFSVVLDIARDCLFDGVAGWFDCELAPGVRMTNSPFAAGRLERPNALFPVAEPFAVAAGEQVRVDFRAEPEAHLYTWTVVAPDGTRQRQTTWNSRILGRADLMPGTARPQAVTERGEASMAILGMVDGETCVDAIEQAVLARFPGLFDRPDKVRKFVRGVIEAYTR